METRYVTSTDFQNRAGQYLDEAAKAPIFITRYDRPVRVLIDVEEYQRLKRCDTRQALYPHELSDALKAELEKGYQGRHLPELDQLME